jgi:large repetitive protein
VLEYYEPTSNTWEVVGEINQGIRWYQSNFLLSRPGGQRNNTLQPTGWTGFSEGWDNVRYRLDQFAGKSSVRFRVAFAASSNTVLVDQPQGFAFDSVWIGERGRNVLVEHFTNFMTPDVYFVEQGLYDKIYNNMYGRDVTMIQYHIEFPSLDDQYNLANVVDPAARALNPYGLNTYNRAVVDGLPRGDGTTLNLDIREFDLDMLQFPAFSIFIAPIVINGNDITVNSTILAMQDMPDDDYAIMTAILEDSLPNQVVNQNSYIYPLMGVMRKLLPNNAGRNYTGTWWQGQQLANTESYTMTTPIPSNPALLHAAVFIQSRTTKDVFQVATTRDLTIYAFDSLTTVVPGQPNQVADETSSLKLYPNPATNYFTVEFDQALQTEQTWQLVDVLGRVLQTGKAPIGTTNFQVNTENLSAAPYFFTIRNASVYTQRQVIITKP